MSRFWGVTVLCLGLGWAGIAGARLPDPPAECDLATIKSFDYCPECRVLVEKEALNSKGQHADCGKMPIKADFCVKTYYLCEACGARSDQPGKCATCKTDLKSHLSKSKIVFLCKSCGARADQAKVCDVAGCEGKGKPYVKTCAESGNPPHVRRK